MARKYTALLLCVVILYGFSAGSPAPGYCSEIIVITINDPITPVIAEYIIHEIEAAEKLRAECLVVQLDTPGGLDLAMRDIVKKIFSSEVPVIVYVSPSGARAASAGAIITFAAHVAAMSPGTNIGAAHPVSIGFGEQNKEMFSKIENDSAAYAESIAEKRRRNKEWAVKAVRESLSASETDALKAHVIDLIASDTRALLAAIDGIEVETPAGLRKLKTKDAQVTERTMGMREIILKSLADPTIAYILLLVGLAGLYFELSTPGAILPGAIGGIALLLAFYSLQTLSANYAGLLLILLGVILFIAEIKVTSYGLLSIGGIVAVVLGSLMLFDSPVPYLRISWSVIISSALLIWAFFVVVVGFVVKAQRRKKQTGMEVLIGAICEVSVTINPHGKVFVHGEYWNAQSIMPINKGEQAIITAVNGMNLTVMPLSKQT
jgi:membrane-bound serine protease (ClpP class)